MKFLYEKFGETNINHYLCTRKSETKSHNAKCGCDAIQTIGEMAEWSNAPVLKTGVLRGTGGSNPSLSAFNLDYQGVAKQVPEKVPKKYFFGFLFTLFLTSTTTLQRQKQ